MRTLNIAEMEKMLFLVIQKLKSENISGIEIKTDLYRYIPTDKWDSFENIEKTVENGSLFDDIDCLKNTVNENANPFTYVDFDRLASVLRIISEIMSPRE